MNIICKHSFTTELHLHKAINYCFIIVDRNSKVRFEKQYTGMALKLLYSSMNHKHWFKFS